MGSRLIWLASRGPAEALLVPALLHEVTWLLDILDFSLFAVGPKASSCVWLL